MRLTAAEFKEWLNTANIPTEELDFFRRLDDTLTYYENMAGEEFRMPNLANATTPFLVDELGQVQSEIKPRERYVKVLKEVLKSRKPGSGNVLEGEKYQAVFGEGAASGYTASKLREKVDSAILEECSYYTPYTTIETKKR